MIIQSQKKNLENQSLNTSATKNNNSNKKTASNQETELVKEVSPQVKLSYLLLKKVLL